MRSYDPASAKKLRVVIIYEYFSVTKFNNNND